MMLGSFRQLPQPGLGLLRHDVASLRLCAATGPGSAFGSMARRSPAPRMRKDLPELRFFSNEDTSGINLWLQTICVLKTSTMRKTPQAVCPLPKFEDTWSCIRLDCLAIMAVSRLMTSSSIPGQNPPEQVRPLAGNGDDLKVMGIPQDRFKESPRRGEAQLDGRFLTGQRPQFARRLPILLP